MHLGTGDVSPKAEQLMQQQKDLLLVSLRRFYDDSKKAEVLLDVLQQKKGYPSLRILDWLITNYSRSRNVLHTAKDSKGNYRQMSISANYRLQLRAYSKRRFDPFCRRGRIVFSIYDSRSEPSAPSCSIVQGLEDDTSGVLKDSKASKASKGSKDSNGELTWPAEGRIQGQFEEGRVHHLITTVGQLCFFRWAISNDILGYAMAHRREIEKDMMDASKNKEHKEPVEDVPKTEPPRVARCRNRSITMSFR